MSEVYDSAEYAQEQEIITPEISQVEAFWTRALNATKLQPAAAYMAQDGLLSLVPVAFAYGADQRSADEYAQAVLSGKKRATTSYVPAYEEAGVGLPSSGTFSVLCDGQGVPRALLYTTEVLVQEFADIAERTALLEGEGDGSIAQWQEIYREVFTLEAQDLGYEFTETDLVITEFFEVFYAE